MSRAWVEVDLDALVRNGRRVLERAGVPLLPMVKADAYGLGAVPVARALEVLEPWGFGVATVAEGEELRRAGVTRPVVVFTPLLVEELEAARAARLTPTFGRPGEIRRWAATGLPWQLAIDTGMNRAGIPWTDVGSLHDVLIASPPEGAFTHLHSAERDDGSRELQEDRFAAAIARLPTRPPLLHVENSPGVEALGASRWDLARPGVFLYGVGTDRPGIAPEQVAAVRARVVDLRTVPDGETVSYDATWRAVGARRIATLSIGYADGYRRALSNRGSVILNGRCAAIAGLVTMDMTMVDVTDVPCEIGDVATLVGAAGDQRLDLADVARTGDVSPYEFLTGLRARLPRQYTGGPA